MKGSFIAQREDVLDGASASASVAYLNSQTAYIYPITPSTTASETFETLGVAGKKNIFDQVNVVRQLQSEAGAAGSVHGSLSVGALTTTFTASQGLLLMIPVMYKIAGELLPTVFHVPARSVAQQALCIFGDHTDVMACRQTGWALMSSSNVQESADLAQVSHMATIDSSIPFLHFYDGFRTSHELNKVKLITLEGAKSLTDYDAITEFKKTAMHPVRPVLRGTAQQPDVYMQNVELANRYYDAVPDKVQKCMDKFSALLGRQYKLFDYIGNPEATDVIVLMGAGVGVVREIFEYYRVAGGSKSWGCVIPRLYRPWSRAHFLGSLPKTVKRIAVVDRTKEYGSLGEPLYLDVVASCQLAKLDVDVLGGRYGLGSREFTPPMVQAIFDNLASDTPKSPFTVGIEDDVTFLSLPYDDTLRCVPENTTQCLFYGMGSDGTVGANKNVIKIIGMNTEMFAQGYFAYSAYKAGGLTISHLRFGPKPLHCPYLIDQASYIAVHRDQYVFELDILDKLQDNGIFVLNCEWDPKALEAGEHIPDQLKGRIAAAKAKFYCIDANKVAREVGMGRRVNSILMTVFFYVSGVLPMDVAIKLFKDAIQKSYGKKGPAVVEANWRAVDAAIELTHEIKYDQEAWAKIPVCNERLPKTDKAAGTLEHFAETVVKCATSMNPNLPVSAFKGYEGGVLPPGTTAFEKRGIALNIPVVDMDKCTQCNYCAFVCPHAAIRPFLMDDDEKNEAPETFDTRKTKGMTEVAGLHYRIQVAPLDCTGCELCSIACPDDALTMLPLQVERPVEEANWGFALTIKDRGHLIPGASRNTLKGSQFYKPLLEFSGACEGCGETPYVKLITQLFGERLIIANATGCSSIWGASYPSAPYTVNDEGFGPAWGNSLFEDAAEYGYGMVVSLHHRRDQYRLAVEALMADEGCRGILGEEYSELVTEWLEIWDTNPTVCQEIYMKLRHVLPTLECKDDKFFIPARSVQMIIKPSIWVVGGDGWAADIGYGGLDHVLSSGVEVNICVLDTEVYSNTGGQKSKATVLGAQHKFAMSGHTCNKKDLGQIFMEYGNIYVASCASSANMAQTVRCFHEADRFRGPSIIMAYSPCIEHNYIKPFSSQILHCKLAVECGYWLLYRYNPDLAQQGEIPLQMDFKKLKRKVHELLERENRYKSLFRSSPELAAKLMGDLEKWIIGRFTKLMFRAKYGECGEAMVDAGGDGQNVVDVLYASETGNAEETAMRMGKNLKARGLTAKVQAFSEVEVEDIKAMKQVVIFAATAGQGEIPADAIPCYEALKAEGDEDCLKDVKFSVMGLGDSTYIYFNEAAIRFVNVFKELGAQQVGATGMGDDQHEDKYETELAEWWPETASLFSWPDLQNVKDTPEDPLYAVENVAPGKYTKAIHQGTMLIDLITNDRMTPEDYNVEVVHLEFDLLKTGMKYALGDSLALWHENDSKDVQQACDYFGLDVEQWISIKKVGKESNSKLDILFKKPMTIKQLFTEVFDLFGKPNRSVYETLYKYCTDPSEKAKAKSILDKDKVDELRNWSQKETISIFDLMKRFPSAKFTLELLIDMLPVIKCRYYSIASSQKFVAHDRIELCVGVVDWTDSLGRDRQGSCTSMLSRFRNEMRASGGRKTVCAAIKATAFHLPDSDEKPVIVAGMGTGIAPFRAFIQYRAWLKRNDKPVGPLTVYFGCRYQAKDFLYKEELQDYLKEGVITDLKLAFSRDGEQKFYIQNLIDKEPELMHKRLHVEGGYFYLCGSASQVPIDMRKAITAAMMKMERWDFETADKYITKQIMDGRYNVEAWG